MKRLMLLKLSKGFWECTMFMAMSSATYFELMQWSFHTISTWPFVMGMNRKPFTWGTTAPDQWVYSTFFKALSRNVCSLHCITGFDNFVREWKKNTCVNLFWSLPWAITALLSMFGDAGSMNNPWAKHTRSAELIRCAISTYKRHWPGLVQHWVWHKGGWGGPRGQAGWPWEWDLPPWTEAEALPLLDPVRIQSKANQYLPTHYIIPNITALDQAS